MVPSQFQRGVFCLIFALSSRSGIALTSATTQHHVFKNSHLPLVGGGLETCDVGIRNIGRNSTAMSAFATKEMDISSPDTEATENTVRSFELLNQELEVLEKEKKSGGPLKVLFLSADTGGGHRASAEALAAQFLIHFPGSSYDLLDVWTNDGVGFYKTLVKTYTHMSAHPRQWRILYYMSNSVLYTKFIVWHSSLLCERRIRRRMASYDPDVVVSVHPTMNGAPLMATKKISKALGKHIPFFTVVTDLGSGHTTWFSKHVEKLYVASEPIRKLAKRKGRASDDILVMSGLPIRHAFAEESKKLQDRTSPEGKAYQLEVRKELGIADPIKKTILVMGGGEGVGKLSSIVDSLYAAFVKQGVNATIYVVCGRNEKLKKELETRDWELVVEESGQQRKWRKFTGRRNRNREKIQHSLDRATENEEMLHSPGNVDVVGLGYVTRMAEYMVAADVLVTKAGPGTIAEAASVGLPCMLTSFLPGQEAGNVDVVLDSGFGDYCDDPVQIGREVSAWIQDEKLLTEMSRNAREAGHPDAAQEIVLDIGTITNTWKNLNAENQTRSALSLQI